MEFSGRLAAFPLPDILQWVANERRTGTLVVRRSGREKWVRFGRGEVVGCVSDDPGEFFGQYLVLRRYIDQDELVMALTFCKKQGCRLGEALSELGMITPETVRETLRRQTQDSICDLFLWAHGVFYFVEEEPPAGSGIPEPIDTITVAMEGARWADEHRRIRQIFPHDEVTLGPGPAWPAEDGAGATLSPLEACLVAAMAAMDGRGGTLAELHASVKGSYFRFLETARNLAVRGIVDIESVGEGSDPPGSEPSLYDLLFEQAAEAEELPLSRTLSLPLELVQRFYPLWLGDADEDEMAEAARNFYRRFDGATPLAEILAEGPAARSREMELLLLQLRRGNVALLPAPISKVERTRKERIVKRWWRGRRPKG